MRQQITKWASAAALSLGAAGQALACAFHGYTPQPTVVDVLLTTEQVVAARPLAGNPGRYGVVETLVGPDGSEIAIPVGEIARQRLAAAPASQVLLARDGAYGPWVELAILDPAYRKMVDGVLRQQDSWLYGGDAKRLAYFAKRVNDANPDIRRLALHELDRVPYHALRSTRLPRVKGLAEDLQKTPDGLTPIRVLLAGLSGNRHYQPLLWSGLDRAIAQDLAFTGAYATALIELEGQSAVDKLLADYLAPGTQPQASQEKVLQALVIQHKTAPRATRRAIARGLTGLLRSSPELMKVAVTQFGFVGR